MTTAAAHSAPMSFRRAAPADVPFLLGLRHDTMSEHLRNSGVPVTDDELRERVLADFECAEIVLIDERPIGLLKVRRDGLRWHLIQIQLAPAHQSQGLGTAILQALLAEAARAGASVTLSVLLANPARRLYERLGFRVTGQDAHSYEMVWTP